MTSYASTVKLKRYAPGLRQAMHAHEAPHLSLVIAGGFEEQAGQVEDAIVGGRVGLRPEGLRHAVAFGPQGALVLTCTPPPADRGGPTISHPHWSRVLPGEHLRRLIPLLLEGDDESVEASWDLIALASQPEAAHAPDPWIAAVRDQLLAEPGAVRLSDLAARAGRHRVHLGRTFLSAFGETPSVFRRRAMLDRALCLAAGNTPAAQAALDAGFVDQSHFNRACRDAYGLAPGRLLRRAA